MKTDLRSWDILKSFFGNEVSQYRESLEKINNIQDKKLFSATERQYFLWLQNKSRGLEKYPTESLFVRDFPDTEIPLSTSTIYPIKDLSSYIDQLILQRQNLRNSQRAMDIASRIADGSVDESDIDALRDSIRTNTFDISEDKDAVALESNFRESFKNRNIQHKGALTGIDFIDGLIGGLQPGTMSVIAGFTSQGKSLLANNIAYLNSFHNNYNVVILSLEVSKMDLMYNILSRHSAEDKFSSKLKRGINALKLRRGELSQEELDVFVDENNGVIASYFNERKGNLRILDESDFSKYSFSEIESKLFFIDEELIEKTGHGIDMIIVDHIQLLKFSSSRDDGRNFFSDEKVQLNEYVSFFRKLSMSFGRDDEGNVRQIHVMLVSQTSRTGWSEARNAGRKDQNLEGRYTLIALSEANELERAAHVVITIYTNTLMKKTRIARVCLLKNRAGMTEDTPYTVDFDPEVYYVGQQDGQGSAQSQAQQDVNVFDNLMSGGLDDSGFDSLGSLSLDSLGI